mmetsp:Transcript_17041/g.33930  ORF Transcript_17041/g.33930 Transcript_17041/m.33930 type:complete len:281 (+) Transcript_17041:231-1073(+)
MPSVSCINVLWFTQSPSTSTTVCSKSSPSSIPTAISVRLAYPEWSSPSRKKNMAFQSAPVLGIAGDREAVPADAVSGETLPFPAYNDVPLHPHLYFQIPMQKPMGCTDPASSISSATTTSASTPAPPLARSHATASIRVAHYRKSQNPPLMPSPFPLATTSARGSHPPAPSAEGHRPAMSPWRAPSPGTRRRRTHNEGEHQLAAFPLGRLARSTRRGARTTMCSRACTASAYLCSNSAKRVDNGSSPWCASSSSPTLSVPPALPFPPLRPEYFAVIGTVC